MGRPPEAWVAPPPMRELRELVRHRAKLVALRAGCKCEVHAVLAKCGIAVPMDDLFSDAGTGLLEHLRAQSPYLARVGSLRRLIDHVDAEIDLFAGPAQLASWAGLTPKHHESDTHVHRAGSPSRDPGWSGGQRSSRSSHSDRLPAPVS
jgi:transposase